MQHRVRIKQAIMVQALRRAVVPHPAEDQACSRVAVLCPVEVQACSKVAAHPVVEMEAHKRVAATMSARQQHRAEITVVDR